MIKNTTAQRVYPPNAPYIAKHLHRFDIEQYGIYVAVVSTNVYGPMNLVIKNAAYFSDGHGITKHVHDVRLL